MITKGVSGIHQIQGIGANFIPENYNASLIDEVMTITNENAIKTAKELASTEGIFCGISSGAALKGAIELSKREENKGKLIVAILPDTGMRYLSSVMFQD